MGHKFTSLKKEGGEKKLWLFKKGLTAFSAQILIKADEGEGGRKGKRQDEGKLAERRTAVSRRKGR